MQLARWLATPLAPASGGPTHLPATPAGARTISVRSPQATGHVVIYDVSLVLPIHQRGRMRPIREPGDRPFGHRHHAGHHGPAPVNGIRGRSRRGGRGRAPRGDIRTAVLLLLAEQPMHGYQ